jgi:hypothetical protein
MPARASPYAYAHLECRNTKSLPRNCLQPLKAAERSGALIEQRRAKRQVTTP